MKYKSLLRKFFGLALLLMIGHGAFSQLTVGTIPKGDSIVIRHDVTIIASPPPGTNHIAAQWTIQGSNFANFVSDDPDTGVPLDSTITVLELCPTITVTNPGVTTGTAGTAFSQTFTASGGTSPYTFTSASTLPVGLSLSSAGVLSGTPTQSGTFLIVVTATDNTSCTGNGPTYTLVIGCPAVSVNPVSNQVLCHGSATTVISFSGSPAGTVFNWTNNAPSIGLAASGTGNIASFTVNNVTAAPIVATITVTPTFGVNCNGTPITFTITVNPIPDVAQPANQAVCNNTATAAVNFTGAVTGTVYNWTNTTTSIGLAASGTGNIASFTASNAGNIPVTATITVTPTFTNAGVTCSGTPKIFTITVNPTPVVSIVPAGPVTICSGSSVTLTASATCTTVAFSGLMSGAQEVPANASTARAVFNGTFNSSTNQLTLNISFSGLTANATAAHVHNAAVGVNGPVIIPLTAFPAVTSGSYSNSFTVPPAQVANLMAGNTYINIHNAVFPGGEIRGQITNLVTNGYSIAGPMNGGMEVPANASTSTGNFAGTYNDVTGMLKLDLIFNNLIGGNASAAHVHSAAPGINGPVIIPLSGFPAATSGSYSNIFAMPPAQVANFLAGNTYVNIHNATFPGGEIRGQIAPPAAICASNTYLWSPGGATTKSITVSAANTYTVTVTDGNNCSGSANVVVNVNPIPTVDPVANQVVCNGSSTAAVNFTGSVPGTVYNWTNNTTSIGLAGSGTGNIASFTAINTGTAPVVATITVTPSYTNGGTTCTGTPIAFTISVNPTPDVNQPANQVVCNGAPTTPVIFTGSVAGTVFNWTNNTTSIGLAASGTGNIAAFTATNATTAPLVATVTVTPQTGGAGSSLTFTNTTPITIPLGAPGTTSGPSTPYPSNIVVSGVSGTVTAVTVKLNNFNHTFPDDVDILLVGPGGQNAIIMSDVGTSLDAVGVTLNLDDAAATSMPDAAQLVTGTFKPTNIGAGDAFSAPAPAPSGGSVLSVFNSIPANGTWSLYVMDDLGGDVGNFNGGWEITITAGSAGPTCTGTPITFTYTVNPTATINAVANQVVCNGASTSAVNFSSPTTGGTIVYNWTNNTTSIGLAASGTGNIASFTATNVTNAPVVATITVTPTYTNGGISCVGTPISFTITVNPTATVTAVPNQVVCNGAPTTAVNFSSPTTGGTIVYNWTNNTTSIGLAASGSGNIASFTATNVTNAPVVATITVAPTYTNGGVSCAGTPISFTITVNPTATVNAVPNQVVCNGAPTTAVNFSSPTSGGTIVYNWTNNTTSIGLAASGSGNIASFTATNVTNVPVVATITVTPTYTNGGVSCVGTPITYTITVNPTATIDPVANRILCNGAVSAAIIFTSPTTGGTIVYNWTNSLPSIGLAASGTGNIPSFTAINLTNAPVVATITVTPSYTNGGVTCVGTAITFTITVNPPPIINPVASQVVCNNSFTANVIFTTPTTGGTAVYNWTNNNTSIGLAASGTGNILSFPATNPGNAPVVATITVILSYTSGGLTCLSLPITFTITVNPTPIVNQPLSQTVCNGAPTAAVNFTSPTTGGTLVYNWTNSLPSIGLAASGTGNISSFTAINTGATAVTAIITVTPIYTNAGVTCTGLSKIFTITVNPTPVVNPVANQVLCNGSLTATVVFTSSSGSSANVVFNWTNNNTSIGLAASGTGNIPGFTATNTTNAPVTATITVTGTYTGGGVSCTGPPMTFTITVNPTPTVNAQANQTVCASVTTVANFTGFVPGTVYNWTNSNTAIGLGTLGSGNISFVATNATTAPITATITVTPSYTNGGVTCSGTPISFTITVNPTPTVSAVPNQVLCNGSNTTAVTFSGAVAGTVFNWTNSNTTIGLAASGTGNIASFIATNVTTVPQTATITVTPSANGCTGLPVSFTITVNPTPSVNAIASQTVCNGSGTAAVTITGPVAGTVFNWSNNNTSIGLGASGAGNIGSFTAINNTNAPVTATITVTPTYTNGGVSCTGASTSFTITVNPTPSVNAIASQTVCNGSNTAAVNFSGGVAGTTYSWTNSNTAIGLAASGTGNIGSFTATNSSNAPITATITVTPSAAGCTGLAVSFTITVNPTPTVNQPPSQPVCAGGTTVPVVFTGSVPTTVYNWTNNNTTIGLAASGTGDIPAFVAINATNAAIVATITVTPTFTSGGVSCTGASRSFNIIVTPQPNIVFIRIPPRVCLTDTLVTLRAIPAGGTWSGRGVTGNIFSATAAGLGVTTISYTVTNANGCTATAYVNVTVNDCIERHNIFASAIRLYPNPSSGQFNIRFLSDVYKEFSVKIVTAGGQELKSYHFSGLVYGSVIPMNLQELPSGTYFLEVYNTQERASFPFVIVR